MNKSNNRTLIIGFSNCGKTYATDHILHQKQEQFFIIKKSRNEYPNISAQTSKEIQPIGNYENSTVVFDNMLLSKQENCFFLKHETVIMIYTTYLKAFFISPYYP